MQQSRKGIYKPDMLSTHGHTILFAVDDHGRYVAHALVFPTDNEEEVAAMLERILDQDVSAFDDDRFSIRRGLTFD